MLDEELFIEDEPTFEELITVARDAYEAEGDESAEYWDTVWILTSNRDEETLDGTLKLSQGDSFERILAATVLARMGLTRHLTPSRDDDTDDSQAKPLVDVLLDMVEAERDENVLKALVSSLSRHQEIDERIPAVVQQFFHHPSVAIRWCLAVGLDSYETPEAVAMILALTRDEDAEIRLWATSNLETEAHVDSAEIRHALLARMDDEVAEVRVEAMYGLAKRKEALVVPAIIREFEAKSFSDLFDALVTLPDYGLALALRQMAEDESYQGNREELQTAMDACAAYSKLFAQDN